MLTHVHNRTEEICDDAYRFHKVRGNNNENHVFAYMLQALVPAKSHEKTRHQIIVEENIDTGAYIRPVSLRAGSEHQSADQLDPTRVAAVVTEDLLSKIPGLFHITEQRNLASIVAHGLQPGHRRVKHGRLDIHVSPFSHHTTDAMR